METSFSKHVIYKKDGEGSIYAMGESVYKNEIIQYPPRFPAIGTVLRDMQKFSTRRDDVWLIDYIKSGTHWVNDIVNVLLTNEIPAPFDKLKMMLEFVMDVEDLDKLKSPRILNTHFPVKYIPEHIIEGSKVIYILRNPKSVAVSAYYHFWNLKSYEYEGNFAGFLPVYLHGLGNFYGNWFDTVTDFWQKYKDSPNVLVIVYEDLKQNTVEGVKKISDFLGLEHDMKFCEHVVEQTKFETMKARETAALEKQSVVRGKEWIYRKGSTSDWKNHFTVAQNEMFDAIYEEKMKDFPDLKTKIRFS